MSQPKVLDSEPPLDKLREKSFRMLDNTETCWTEWMLPTILKTVYMEDNRLKNCKIIKSSLEIAVDSPKTGSEDPMTRPESSMCQDILGTSRDSFLKTSMERVSQTARPKPSTESTHQDMTFNQNTDSCLQATHSLCQRISEDLVSDFPLYISNPVLI